MSKLMGFKRFSSKKNGKNYCVADVVTPYTTREKSAGAIGQKAEQIFLPENQYDLLRDADLGKDIQLEYELSGGRAYLASVTVK